MNDTYVLTSLLESETMPFFIDLNGIDIRSLYADDNGVWDVGTPRKYFRVEIKDGKITDVVPSHQRNYTHLLKRQYGKHQATSSIRGKTFQRIISTVFSRSGHRCRYAVLQYIQRDGNEDDIVMLSHANTKKKTKRPFMKTDPDVIEAIKEEPLATKPRKMFKTMMDEAGGQLYSSAAASEPRNLQQIYNIRKGKKAEKCADDFTHLLSQVKESSFVHDLTIDGTSVQYVLASEKQLKDVELFCTHPIKFSIFSIDSTYNVGNFYVTNTCYQNFKIVHADGRYRGRHPYEIGPTFIHTEKGTNNFVSFFSSLLRMNPNLRTIQAIGCDGDEAIMNASVVCFQDAQKLLCSSHKKDNIRRKLKNDFRAKDVACSHIIADIFGKDSGTIYEKGLIDSNTEQEFDRKVMMMKATWECLQPGFHSWFLQFQAELFRKHLIACVTELARIDKHYSTNQVESTNDNIKDWLGRTQKLSFPVTNRKIEEYVTAQQQEFEIAIYGNGPYDNSESHEHLRKNRHNWNSMTVEQRRDALKSFWSSPVIASSATRLAPVREPDISEPAIPTGSHRPANRLSVSADDADLAVLSKEMLRELWIKAEELLRSSDSVVNAPGFNGMYVQHMTNTGNIPPHLVTSQKTGKFVCDCRLYKSSKICEHVITAAETKGKLQKFLDWRKKEKSAVNLTDLVTGSIKSGEKAKVRKPRKGVGRQLIKNQHLQCMSESH